MTANKTATKDLIRDLPHLGDEALTEALLGIIRKGPIAFGKLYRSMTDSEGDPEQLLAPPVRENILRIISDSAFRFLEGAMDFVKPGNELRMFMELLGSGSIADCLLRYAVECKSAKVLLCGDWLASKGMLSIDSPSINGDHRFAVAHAWVSYPPQSPVLQGLGSITAEDIELWLMVLGETRKDASELLAFHYYGWNKIPEFISLVCSCFSDNPSLAHGKLGVCLLDVILTGATRGMSLPPLPESVLAEVRRHASERTVLNIHSQHRSLSNTINGLLKYADCIQEWNEWSLQGFGMGSDVIASKILEEAKAGHREAVSLTRHIQTLEEAELAPGDIYPVLLEAMTFGTESEGIAVTLGLSKGLPEVLLDERMFRLAVSEAFAFLGTVDDGPKCILAESSLYSPDTLGFSLVGTSIPAPSEIADKYGTSLVKSTVDRVMRVHSGSVQTAVGEGSFTVRFLLPKCDVQVSPEVIVDHGNPFQPGTWDCAILEWVKCLEMGMASDITQILAILVHDMKNAFSFIQNWTDGLRSGEKECARSVNRIRENINRLRESAREAEAALSLTDALELAYEDTVQLTEEVLSSLQASADASGIRLIRNYGGSLPKIPVDKGRFRSLVANLVKNAMEASVAGGQVEVTLDLDVSGSILQLVVEDSGEAVIHPEVEHHPAGHPAKVGTGVGLLAAGRIARSHSGTLSMEKIPNRGLRITVDIPAGDDERLLARTFPFKGILSEECVKGLRAGLHMWKAGDASMASWVLEKALDHELKLRLEPHLKSHMILPGVLAWLEDVRKARTIGPRLKGRIEAWISENGVDKEAEGRLKASVANLLWMLGKGSWKIRNASHEELAAAVLLFGTENGDSPNPMTLKGIEHSGLVAMLLSISGTLEPGTLIDLCKGILGALQGIR